MSKQRINPIFTAFLVNELKQHQKREGDEAQKSGRIFSWRKIEEAAGEAVAKVLGRWLKGDHKAKVNPEIGKLDLGVAGYLNDLLKLDNATDEYFSPKKMLKVTVSVPAADRKEFAERLKALVGLKPEIRDALIQACTTLLPRVDGLDHWDKFNSSIQAGVDDYVEYE